MSKKLGLMPIKKDKEGGNGRDKKGQRLPQCPLTSGLVMAKNKTVAIDGQAVQPVIVTQMCMGSRCALWDATDDCCGITSALFHIKRMKKF